MSYASKQIHDDLDAAVFAAFGWPVTLSDEEILERLVALNAERAAEEQRGLTNRIDEMLNALASLGMARHVSDGKYISA